MTGDFVYHDLGQQMQGAIVTVTLDKRANVLLLDGPNFDRYRRGAEHRYIGGEARVSPLRVGVPHAGHWYVVLDLGGASGQIRSSVNVLPRAA